MKCKSLYDCLVEEKGQEYADELNDAIKKAAAEAPPHRRLFETDAEFAARKAAESVVRIDYVKSTDQLIQEIYDRERNAEISWFWDGGFDARIGDETNGWLDSGKFETYRQAVEWLHAEIVLKAEPPAKADGP